MRQGLSLLAESGCDLVFVLGHPGFYTRFGFRPAGCQGLSAPYPIPEQHRDAWMVRTCRDGTIGRVAGKVQCAAALDKPEHWQE